MASRTSISEYGFISPWTCLSVPFFCDAFFLWLSLAPFLKFERLSLGFFYSNKSCCHQNYTKNIYVLSIINEIISGNKQDHTDQSYDTGQIPHLRLKSVPLSRMGFSGMDILQAISKI